MQMSWVEVANFSLKITASGVLCCVALSLPHVVPLTISMSCHACRGDLGYPIMIYLSFSRPKDDNLKSTPMNTATVKIDDDTLKGLPNPFYGYGTHQEDHTINSGTYSEVQTELQPDIVKEVANPTYGITDVLYTTDTNQRETVGTSLSSSELYTEVPANKEVRICEAPDDK